MTSVRWSHVIVVLTAAIVLQTGLLDQAWLFERLRVDVMVLLVVAVGLRADARTALILGFLLGLFLDLFRFSPFGFHALLFCLGAWLVASTRIRMLQAGTSFRTIQGGIAVGLVTASTWVGGAVFGLGAPPFDNRTLAQLAIIIVLGAVLIHPASRVAAWMISAPRSSATPRPQVVRAE